MGSAEAISRFTSFAPINEREFTVLKKMAGELRRLQCGAVLRHEGVADQYLYLLVAGWAASTITFAGGGRQMIKVHVEGDVLGLPSLAMSRAPDSIIALTDIEVRSIPSDGLKMLFRDTPRLAAMLFLISQEERVMLMDRVALLGRADAASRLAGLILHLHRRLRRLDPEMGMRFDVPLTQHDLADLVGVTAVHLNRVVQEFRSRRIIRLTRRTIEILDYDALQDLTGLPPRELASNLSWLPD